MRLEQLKTLLEEDPQSSFIHFAIAKEYEKLDQLDNAIAQYEHILQIDPNYAGLYYHYAKLLEILDNPEAALLIYDKGIHICQQQKNQHLLSELQNAKLNLELGL